MIDYDWCYLGSKFTKLSQRIKHPVVPQSPTVVCGVDVANPDEEWRWSDTLGVGRPCDNCGKIIARLADVEASI